MNKEKSKISLHRGKEMVNLNQITVDTLQEMIRNGQVAGIREKESFRLKGVTEKITVAFPSINVTLPKGAKLPGLDKVNAEKVNAWKTAVADAIRPIYETLRDKHTDKVMVKQ